jgi:hypothetical protein
MLVVAFPNICRQQMLPFYDFTTIPSLAFLSAFFSAEFLEDSLDLILHPPFFFSGFSITSDSFFLCCTLLSDRSS